MTAAVGEGAVIELLLGVAMAVDLEATSGTEVLEEIEVVDWTAH